MDGDDDSDNVANNCDNCNSEYNPSQEDTDGDGIGDVCDPMTGKTTELLLLLDSCRDI